MTNDTYNGWTNRETWAAHLYITNDEGLYNEFRGMGPDAIKHALETLSESVIDGYASRDLITMILNIGSLWRIDYRAVAAALKE
jgi:hypothetical protein